MVQTITFTQIFCKIELDAATQAQLARGKVMGEVLKQGQYRPIPVEKQVLIIYLGINGYLDDVPAEEIRAFEERFFLFMDEKHPEIGGDIKKSGEISEEIEDRIRDAIEDFKETQQPA